MRAHVSDPSPSERQEAAWRGRQLQHHYLWLAAYEEAPEGDLRQLVEEFERLAHRIRLEEES